MFREKPSKFNQDVIKQKKEAEFTKYITSVYFKFYDKCVFIENQAKKEIDWISIAKIKKKATYGGIDPCLTFGALMILCTGISYYLSVLVKDNVAFYPNGQTHYQARIQSCYQPRQQGIPFFGGLANAITLPQCHTEEREVKALNYFQDLFILFTIIISITIIINLFFCAEKPDIKKYLNIFILRLEEFLNENKLDEDSQQIIKIIFEESINLNKILMDLKKISAEWSDDKILNIDNVNKIKSIMNKIKIHLISQDKQGYFSNNLTSEEAQERIKSNLYINIVEQNKNINRL